MEEREANRLLTRLHEVHIDAAKEREADGSWVLTVDHADEVAALNHLESARALRASREEGAARRSSLVPSREQQRYEYSRVLAAELEETLAGIAGVLDARVHLNLPSRDPLLGKRSSDPGSASVLLVTRDEAALSVPEVRNLVGGAAGIPAERVAVLTSGNGQSLTRTERTRDAASASGYLSPRIARFAAAVVLIALGSSVIVREALRRRDAYAR